MRRAPPPPPRLEIREHRGPLASALKEYGGTLRLSELRGSDANSPPTPQFEPRRKGRRRSRDDVKEDAPSAFEAPQHRETRYSRLDALLDTVADDDDDDARAAAAAAAIAARRARGA